MKIYDETYQKQFFNQTNQIENIVKSARIYAMIGNWEKAHEELNALPEEIRKLNILLTVVAVKSDDPIGDDVIDEWNSAK